MRELSNGTCTVLSPITIGSAFILFVLAFCVTVFPAMAQTPAKEDKGRYEKDIKKFEDADQANPPAKNGVLFVGSSSIRLWNLKKFFPELNALNRGFGGSMFSDLNFYRDRVILPYAPKTVVLYEGDNDIAHGETPEKNIQRIQKLRYVVPGKTAGHPPHPDVDQTQQRPLEHVG